MRRIGSYFFHVSEIIQFDDLHLLICLIDLTRLRQDQQSVSTSFDVLNVTILRDCELHGAKVSPNPNLILIKDNTRETLSTKDIRNGMQSIK